MRGEPGGKEGAGKRNGDAGHADQGAQGDGFQAHDVLTLGVEAGIGEDGDDVGRHVEEDVEGREDEAAGLHDRHVAHRHRIHHVLAHAGIDEDHLDHDDADDEIGEVEGHDVDDRGDRIRRSVAGDDAESAEALQFRRLHIGR